MKPPSLVSRIIGWQVFMMGVSWVVLVAWLFHMMTAFENGDLDRRMRYFAEILAETASGASHDPEVLAQRLRATEKTFVEGVIETLENAAGYKATFQVFDDRGALLYRTGSAPATPLTQTAGLSLATLESGDPWRLARVRSSDQSVTVIVGESESDRWGSIRPMLQIIGAAQILILASSLLITWWATRRGIRPLKTLADKISQREAGDSAPITAPVVYSETVPIVRELNAVQLGMNEGDLEFVVRDDGPGIAPEERDRVFERYYRVPGSTAHGSGLGLAIVQRFARAHNASVRFVDGLTGAGIGVVVRLHGAPVPE